MPVNLAHLLYKTIWHVREAFSGYSVLFQPEIASHPSWITLQCKREKITVKKGLLEHDLPLPHKKKLINCVFLDGFTPKE